MTSGPDISNYDPFEDTGDWPFRDAPPKPERDVAPEPEPEPAEPQVFENTELSQPAIEDDAELESEPPIEELLPVAMEPEPEPEPEPELEPEPVEAVAVVEEVAEADVVVDDEPALEEEPVVEEEEVLLPAAPVAEAMPAEHAPGELLIPPGVEVLAGGPHGFRRNVAVVVSRFNGDITTGLLDGALTALRECNVGDDAITIVPVPGAFELPLTALALAKTRRLRVRRRAWLHHPGGDAALRSHRERGGERAPTGGDRDGHPGRVRRDHDRDARAGGGAHRPRCRGGPHGARDGGSLLTRADERRRLVGRLLNRSWRRSAAVCGKKPGFGHSRSHSMVATKRRFDPNLQRVRVLIDGTAKRAYVCTRCLRSGAVQKAV